MDVRAGDRVMVNLAPFQGAEARSEDSVPCEVLAGEGDCVQVRTVFPYGSVELRLPSRWIEAAMTEEHTLLALHD